MAIDSRVVTLADERRIDVSIFWATMGVYFLGSDDDVWHGVMYGIVCDTYLVVCIVVILTTFVHVKTRSNWN